MLSYAIVGSGYRSEYYARIARTYPELFRAMYLCRSTEKAMECPGQEIGSGSFPWEYQRGCCTLLCNSPI